MELNNIQKRFQDVSPGLQDKTKLHRKQNNKNTNTSERVSSGVVVEYYDNNERNISTPKRHNLNLYLHQSPH